MRPAACGRAPTLPSGTSTPSSSADGTAPPRTRVPPRRRRSRADRDLLPPSLDRALAFAPDHFKRGVLGPVDEVVHVLEVELDRHRQILYASLELLGSHALHEHV